MDNSKPLVSIIMNCYNGERYLTEALDSIFNQTFKDWEVIFWDNASTDESAKIAKSYGNKVKYFYADKTTPISSAREEAFKRANGDYLAILDVDDLWYPEKLEKQVELFNNKPEVAVVYSDAVYFDEDGDKYNLFNVVKPYRGKVFGKMLAKNCIASVTLMFKKTAIESLDYLYDKQYVAIEDYDLYMRIAINHEFDYLNDILGKRRMGSGDTFKQGFRFNFAKERLDLLEKFLKDYPEKMINYPIEIEGLKSECYRQLSFEHWEQGNTSKARAMLLPHIGYLFNFVVYVCTWIFPSFQSFDNFNENVLFVLRSKLR